MVPAVTPNTISLDIVAPLALAIIAVLVGHTIRAVRWGMLLPEHYARHRFDLLVALALGYAANALMPFRLGEILRAATATVRIRGERKDQALATIAASILVERMTDLPIAALLLLAYGISYAAPAGLLVALAVLVAAGLAVHRRPEARRVLWILTLPFNHAVRLGLAHCAWEYGQAIANRVYLRPRYIAASLLMWLSYLCAYGALGVAVHQQAAETVRIFLANPLTPLLSQVADASAAGFDLVAMSIVIVFALLPVAAILAFGARELRQSVRGGIDAFQRRLDERSGPTLRRTGAVLTTRERYREQSVYDAFLNDLFSGRGALTTRFSLALPENAVVHRFFHGGSDALTGLVEQAGTLRITKFAINGAARKLQEQVDWLDRARANGLSVTECSQPEATGEGARYEMPLVIPANDFYDVIHTGAADRSAAMLTALIGRVEAHHRASRGVAGESAVQAYLTSKAIQNHDTIVAFLKGRLGTNFTLNGEAARIEDFARLADAAWLRAQVTRLETADIHGDLTIDNVIATPSREAGYYLIDPNPDNLFNSPLIDWAKLMQSLHLGYEAVNRLIPPTGRDGLVVPLIRSQRYAELHDVLEAGLRERLGADGLREVYFHEIVNYLRLTPYKIRQNPDKGLVFAGATLILLKRYTQRFGR